MADESLRFIQIVASAVLPNPTALYLFGLTKEGVVYQWENLRGGWRQFPMTEATWEELAGAAAGDSSRSTAS